jgi:hypothetical protein
MNRFQKLLLAPAALGLMAPVAASAADLNIAGVSQYGSEEQVTSITQFSDVQPTDWAYQALSNLIERYGCVAGYPNGTYKGKQAMTRYEAAALLNACLDRITEVTDELKRLMKEFEKELAVLKGRVDGLEAKVAELEATQFSTTTKLKGIATFVLGANSFGGTANTARNGGTTGNQYTAANTAALEGATTFNYDVRLNFDTSFTGKDLLRTTLRAGNFADSAFTGGTNQLEIAFQEGCGTGVDCGDVVAINRLFYQFPLGQKFTATVGGKVRIDDMLAMWPSVYPADTVLDTFTYAGAQGAYNLNALGGGAGLWYKDGGFSFSSNYVAVNSDAANSNPAACINNGTTLCGGVGTAASQSAWVNQLAYSGSNAGIAVAYTYGRGLGLPNATPLALSQSSATAASNSVGVSGYWQPSKSSIIPSFSAGWGITGYTNRLYTQPNRSAGFSNGRQAQAQSWMVGMQWSDVFLKGNSAGMAVGQVPFVTSSGVGGVTPQDQNYAWEWWYKFQVTDNISVTPALYYISNSNGQLGKGGLAAVGGTNTANYATNSVNNFGGILKTTFKF